MEGVPTRDGTTEMSDQVDGNQLLDELGDDLMSFDVSESGTNAVNPRNHLPPTKDTPHQSPLQEVHTSTKQEDTSFDSSSATTTVHQHKITQSTGSVSTGSQKPSDIFSQLAENLKNAQSRGKGVVSIIDYLCALCMIKLSY